MTTLIVGSLCRYLTDSSAPWREDDYHARAIVKGVKKEDFNGFVQMRLDGVWRRFDKANIDNLTSIVMRDLGRLFVSSEVRDPFTIIPIPNSSMAIGAEGDFRIVELAEMLRQSCPQCVAVRPVLRWAEARTQAHRMGGARYPAQFEPHLRLTDHVDGPVVLFDDVMTSGSQMIAATRILRADGIDVVLGVTVGKTTKVQHEKMLGWEKEQIEIDPPTFVFDAL